MFCPGGMEQLRSLVVVNLLVTDQAVRQQAPAAAKHALTIKQSRGTTSPSLMHHSHARPSLVRNPAVAAQAGMHHLSDDQFASNRPNSRARIGEQNRPTKLGFLHIPESTSAFRPEWNDGTSPAPKRIATPVPRDGGPRRGEPLRALPWRGVGRGGLLSPDAGVGGW